MVMQHFADTLFRDQNLSMLAVYQSGSNDPIDVQVIMDIQQDYTSGFSVRMPTNTILIKVRSSEVTEPNTGDFFVIGQDVYTMDGPAQRDDSLGLIWACPVEKNV